MDAPRIDWAGAEVRDGGLRVPISGEPSKEWRARLKAVLALLSRSGSGDWGEIKVSKQRLAVERVASGTEGDLRHMLESAVQQANSDQASNQAEPDDGDGDAESADGTDQRMTEAFRAFAQDAGGDASGDS